MTEQELKLLYHVICREMREVVELEKKNGMSYETRQRVKHLNEQFNKHFGRDIVVEDIL